MAKIFHAHLHGDRESKYDYLMQSTIRGTTWSEISLVTPFYLLVPQDNRLLSEYEKGWKITEVMPVNAVGFQTHRDYLVISPSKDELLKRIYDFINPSNSGQPHEN